MLGFGKSKEHSLVAVCDGTVIPLDNVSDEVFSGKVLGDGCAVIPESNIIRSPGEGKIISVADTGHAYCIGLVNGLEVLVHIGIDTVELKGEGFLPQVKEGEKVYPGAVIAEADLEFIKSKGYDTTVVTIITNADALNSMSINEGEAKGGVSPAIVCKIK